MKQRLQKIIAQSGLMSRRKAEELIVMGRVKVNGIVVTELGSQADMQDIIQVDNKTIKLETKVTYLINKPTQVISSVSDPNGLVCVVDLIKDKRRLFPIGRLDYYTTGLLLVTNDGQLSQLLTHPSHQLDKQYHVKIRGSLQPWQIQLIQQGLKTKDEHYLPATVKNVKIDAEKKITHFDLTIREGKNRQIRKMMEHFHHEVLKLSRFAIGPLHLNKLAAGQYRKLSEEEIELLIYYAKKGKKYEAK